MAVISGSGSEDAWQVRALITVDDGSTAVNIQSLSEDIEVDMPEREYDKIDLLDDNQMPKHGGLGLCTITINGYTLEAGTITAGTATGWFDIYAEAPDKNGSGSSLSQPIAVTISNVRTRYRVAILLTNDGAATAGTSAVTSGNTYAGKRVILADCVCTKGGPSGTFSANEPQKDQLIFKGIAINKAGNARIQVESIDLATASALDVVGAYTPGAATPW